jgi:Ca2+-binding RTX toxin-like protein
MRSKFAFSPSDNDTFDVIGKAIHASFLPADAGFGGSHSPVNHGTGSGSGTIGSSSTVVVNSSGITFDLIFDTAAMAAPQSFRTGIEQAASILSASISDQITVNIKIDFSGTGGGAAAGPDSGYYESYSSIRSDLLADATSGDTTFNALPSGTSIQGQSNIAVWNAQMKVLGLMNPNDTTTDDGSATFATDINPNLLVGVALHELTHALGRIPYGTAPDIFDLFRYTSPATRLFSGGSTAPAAYFSLDGGLTKIADYGQTSDPSDFLNSGVQGPNDPFNEYYTNSSLQTLTSVDLKQLDALGFHPESGTAPNPPPVLPDLSVSALSLTGTTVHFTLQNSGQASAAASTTGLYLSTDSAITTSDTLLGTYPSPSLPAGGTSSESMAWSLPTNLSTGTHYLGAIADSTSTVAESNENNNASVPIPVIVGNAVANSISGSNAIMFGLAGNDTITSTGGNNVMVGGTGNDKLFGGSGNDQFVFNATNEGIDQIYNFHAGDLVDFAAASFGSHHLAVPGANNTGVLDPSHFVANATGPTNAAQEFWFNTSTHKLYFDFNGSAPGGQVAMAHLQNSYVLHSTDILLV